MDVHLSQGPGEEQVRKKGDMGDDSRLERSLNGLEDSLDSDEEVDVPAETDTDAEELSMDEANQNMRKLLVMKDHSTYFYELLFTTLQAIPLSYFPADLSLIKSAAALMPHVIRGVLDDRTRTPIVCQCFMLLARNRTVAKAAATDVKALVELVYRVQDGAPIDEPSPRSGDPVDEDEQGRSNAVNWSTSVSPSASSFKFLGRSPSYTLHDLRACVLRGIRHMTASSTCQAEFLKNRGLDLCLFVLQDRNSSDSSKKTVLLCLRRSCKATSVREGVASSRGVAVLLDYFFSLPHQHRLQRSTAGLLQTLATNADIKSQMSELGAVPKLVALLSLKQHHMLKYIICVLRNLACNNDENRTLIAQCGGIKKLLDLMPLVNVKLQQKIAGALQNLATNRENRAEITKSGGVSTLITLIKTPDEKLQKYGLGGLKRLVYNSRESTLLFQQLGGLPPLIALLDSEDPSVLKNAVHALNRIRHYIGREPIEVLGGVTAMGRLLTNPSEKVRSLARRNLHSMDEDVGQWLVRIEMSAVRMLRAARVLLNTHSFVLPFAEASRSTPATQGKRTSRSFLTLRRSLSAATTTPSPSSLSLSSQQSSSCTASLRRSSNRSDNASSAHRHPGSSDTDLSKSLDTGMAEQDRIWSQLGFGATYSNLQPFTRHMLPIPVLRLILNHLDDEQLLSRAELNAICAWAVDLTKLGFGRQVFLEVILNEAPNSALDDDHVGDVNAARKSCTVM